MAQAAIIDHDLLEGTTVSRPHTIQTVAIASGKGGVGKTQIALNLSAALAALHRRVILLDADLALGNAAIAAGLQAEFSNADVAAGQVGLRDAILSGPGSISLAPARPNGSSNHLNAHQQASLIYSFSELADDLDSVIIDLPSGINDLAVNFACASQEVVIVVCDEPASIIAAFATIKAINSSNGKFRFAVVSNLVRNAGEGKSLFGKLVSACDDELEVALHYLGHIPHDDNMRLASQTQQLLLDMAPRCRAARAIRSLAEKVAQLPPPAAPSGNLEFFVEKLVQAGS
jgi:flagellar biosynthesis protein FlhG